MAVDPKTIVLRSSNFVEIMEVVNELQKNGTYTVTSTDCVVKDGTVVKNGTVITRGGSGSDDFQISKVILSDSSIYPEHTVVVNFTGDFS